MMTSICCCHLPVKARLLQIHVKISNFIETINSYSEKDFKMNFRLNRLTVLKLIGKYIIEQKVNNFEGVSNFFRIFRKIQHI